MKPVSSFEKFGFIELMLVGGVLLIVFQAVSVPLVYNTAAGFLNAFGGNDFSVIAVLVGGLARLVGNVLGL